MTGIQPINHYNAPKRVKLAAAVGAGVGVATALYGLTKGNLKSFNKIHYGFKEVMALGGGSILGGLMGGIMVCENEDQARVKIREGYQQLVGGLLIPMGCVEIVNNIMKKTKINKIVQAALSIGTMIATTFVGYKATDKIYNKLFNGTHEYQVEARDFLCDVDDVAYAASKGLNMPKLNQGIAWCMPFTYLTMGYKTGTRHT